MRIPTVSIIVPVFNAESTIERCINSILGQSYSDIEIIIIDDGSTDNTYEICERFRREDPRIRIFHQENQGVSAARNIGLLNAAGQYLMFADGDDVIQRDHIQAYVDALRSGGDMVIGGITKLKDGDKSDIEICLPKVKKGVYGCNDFWEKICIDSEPFGYLVNKLFSAETIKQNRISFKTELYSQEDLDFCLSVYSFCERITFIDDIGYLYYYITGKRRPVIHHYVRNQLKLISAARGKTVLSEKAEKSVSDRICILIFSLFYYLADDNQDVDDPRIVELDRVKGLRDYLKTIRIKDEKTMIARLFYHKQYGTILLYFQGRKKLKRFFGMSKKK